MSKRANSSMRKEPPNQAPVSQFATPTISSTKGKDSKTIGSKFQGTINQSITKITAS